VSISQKQHQLSNSLLSIWNNPGQLVPELSGTLTQYATFTVLKFLTSTPNLPSQASHYTSSVSALPTFPPRPPITLLVSQENTGDRLTKHEEPKDKKLHFLYVLLIPLVPSHSITTSWSAAATEMRARVCNPRYFYVGCLSCHNFLYVRAQRQAQNMLACIPWG